MVFAIISYHHLKNSLILTTAQKRSSWFRKVLSVIGILLLMGLICMIFWIIEDTDIKNFNCRDCLLTYYYNCSGHYCCDEYGFMYHKAFCAGYYGYFTFFWIFVVSLSWAGVELLCFLIMLCIGKSFNEKFPQNQPIYVNDAPYYQHNNQPPQFYNHNNNNPNQGQPNLNQQPFVNGYPYQQGNNYQNYQQGHPQQQQHLQQQQSNQEFRGVQ